jgi:hypothetical protein
MHVALNKFICPSEKTLRLTSKSPGLWRSGIESRINRQSKPESNLRSGRDKTIRFKINYVKKCHIAVACDRVILLKLIFFQIVKLFNFFLEHAVLLLLVT